jgi:putative tryptophan/tyrosine transport system substrate-binding protein
MKRRKFLMLVGGAAAVWPLAARSQQAQTAKVGLLYPGPEAAANGRAEILREVLRANGWSGDRAQIVIRFADGDSSRAATLARELVEQKCDVILPVSFLAVDAARKATKTIPIVAFDLETDPTAGGIASDLAHPSGNITGVFFDFPDFSTKWIELLKEAIPHLSKIAIVAHPDSPSPQLKGVQSAAEQFHVGIVLLEIHSLADVEGALLTASRQAADAVLMLSAPPIGVGENPKIIGQLTLKYRLPAITLFPDFARGGGLLAYGVDIPQSYRQAAAMIVKVLNGAKPADLPIERPVKFQLVVNLQSAKALGIVMPTSVLLRADEVIE